MLNTRFVFWRKYKIIYKLKSCQAYKNAEIAFYIKLFILIKAQAIKWTST